MAILDVGPNSTYATIAQAIAAASSGDTISLEPGYGSETADVTVSGLSFTGDASSTGVILQLGLNVASTTLLGTAPFELRDATDANTIVGNDGDNIFRVSSGVDVVTGGGGTDRLVIDYAAATAAITGTVVSVTDGGAYSVTFDGVENFTIATGSGNDTLTLADGANVLNTNAGDDTITAGNGANVVNSGIGNDTITVGNGANSINGGDGNETIIAGNGGNSIIGGLGNDGITSGSGSDFVDAGLGNDTVITGAGADTILVSGGVDTVNGGADADRLVVDFSSSTTNVTGNVTGNLADGYSGSVADGATTSSVVFEGIESFSITSGSGNDTLTTGDGSDILRGGAGDDALNGGGGNDSLYGDAGADFLTGGDGADALFGGAGSDVLSGGIGNDTLSGGDDDDVFLGDLGADAINGGTGIDIVRYSASTSGLVANMTNAALNTGLAAGDTYNSIENLLGSSFDDALTGNSAVNVLTGGSGHDRLYGMGGNDTLSGGAGNDTLAGGAGNDSLVGSSGLDVFRFDAALNALSNVDRISGFSAADDVVELARGVFRGALAGDLTAGAFHKGVGMTTATEADDRVLYDTATGVLSYDVDGAGGAEATVFAILENKPSNLSHADFVFV